MLAFSRFITIRKKGEVRIIKRVPVAEGVLLILGSLSRTLGDAESEIREIEILDLSFLPRIKESTVPRYRDTFRSRRGGGRNHHRDKIPHVLCC